MKSLRQVKHVSIDLTCEIIGDAKLKSMQLIGLSGNRKIVKLAALQKRSAQSLVYHWEGAKMASLPSGQHVAGWNTTPGTGQWAHRRALFVPHLHSQLHSYVIVWACGNYKTSVHNCFFPNVFSLIVTVFSVRRDGYYLQSIMHIFLSNKTLPQKVSP